MRTLVTSLCLAATIGAGATAVAGCGADDAVGLDVAQAAAATAKQGTARITLRMSVEGAGLPLPLEVKASGVTALNAPEGKITFDLGPLLGLAGAPAGTPGELETRFKGGAVYVKPPKLDQLEIPGGKSWVALDLPELASALGLPAEGLGKLFTLEPAAQLRALKAAKGLKEVGEEEIAGAETTHFRGTFRLSDYAATLPAQERAEVKRAIEALDRLDPESGSSFDDSGPVDLWVDEDGITRRMTATTKIPAQDGQPAGTLEQRYELSDFGVALDADPPAAAETYDATDAAAAALKSLTQSATATSPTP